MNTWILILTLHVGNSAAITSVPGFVSKDACYLSGMQWAANTETQLHAATSISCVTQNESTKDTTVPK